MRDFDKENEINIKLAKLIATENITVMFLKGITTAAFNIKTRVLKMPIWKDIEYATRYAFTAHEVGHALYTGEQYTKYLIIFPYMRDLLNICEDNRVDRFIIKKYPGFRELYAESYRELFRRDFYGIRYRDVSTLSFPDRINLYYNTSPLDCIVPFFNDEEIELRDAVNDTQTIDDVIAVAERIRDYVRKTNKQQEPGKDEEDDSEPEESNAGGQSGGDDQEDQNDSDEGDGGQVNSDEEGDEEGDAADGDAGADSDDGDDNDDESGDGSADGDDDADGDDADESSDGADDGDAADGDESSDGADGDESSEDDAGADVDDADVENTSNQKEGGNEGFELETVKAFEESKEKSTVTKKDFNSYVIKYPLINPNVLIGTKTFVVKVKGSRTRPKLPVFVKNDRLATNYAGYIKKEFDMRKKSLEYAGESHYKTGMIDIDRLWDYRTSDDIFLDETIREENESNHKLLFLLDCSGSMHGEMFEKSLFQIQLITKFCDMSSVSYEVIGFFNIEDVKIGKYYDKTFEEYESNYQIIGEKIRLVTLFTDTMKNADKLRIFNELYSFNATAKMYGIFEFSGTPLPEALLWMGGYVEYVKSNSRPNTKISFILLTDGEAQGSLDVIDENGDSIKGYKKPDKRTYPLNIVDINGHIYGIDTVDDSTITNSLVAMIGAKCHSMTWYYMLESNVTTPISRIMASMRMDYDQKANDINQKFTKENFYIYQFSKNTCCIFLKLKEKNVVDNDPSHEFYMKSMEKKLFRMIAENLSKNIT